MLRRGAFAGQSERRQAFPGNVEYDGRLVFVRIRYNSGFGGGFAQARGSRGEPPWAHDYPTADIHLMRILKELTRRQRRSSTARTCSRSTIRTSSTIRSPICRSPATGRCPTKRRRAQGLPEEGRLHHLRRFPRQPLVQPRRADEAGAARGALGGTRRRPRPSSTRFSRSGISISALTGKKPYFGIFEDNDPKKRLMAVAEHNQDLGEFWEFSDTGIDAGRSLERGVQVWRELLHLWIDSLTRLQGSWLKQDLDEHVQRSSRSLEP